MWDWNVRCNAFLHLYKWKRELFYSLKIVGRQSLPVAKERKVEDTKKSSLFYTLRELIDNGIALEALKAVDFEGTIFENN